MSRFVFALGVVAALSGCTFAAHMNGSSVVAGDAHGGVVSRVTTFTLAGAMNMANDWCGQYRLVALETRVSFDEGMDFSCVPPPT
jgi:hypothetical protein